MLLNLLCRCHMIYYIKIKILSIRKYFSLHKTTKINHVWHVIKLWTSWPPFSVPLKIIKCKKSSFKKRYSKSQHSIHIKDYARHLMQKKHFHTFKFPLGRPISIISRNWMYTKQPQEP